MLTIKLNSHTEINDSKHEKGELNGTICPLKYLLPKTAFLHNIFFQVNKQLIRKRNKNNTMAKIKIHFINFKQFLRIIKFLNKQFIFSGDMIKQFTNSRSL